MEEYQMQFDPASVRDQFPALRRAAVFFDGPAGSQTPRRVIDAVAHCLAHTNANTHGEFATSRESDALLAEQLVHSAVTRKGMGRRAIQQLLVKRGVAREVIESVVAELPDDDGDRALDLARDKARTLVRYDDATAMRRLLGMLARRGFGGSQATAAARTAMAEARGEASGASNVVRFR